MTSKEALKELNCVSKWGKERYDIIAKDLERLEKLEKALKIYQYHTFINADNYLDNFYAFPLTQEESNLLKELENE